MISAVPVMKRGPDIRRLGLAAAAVLPLLWMLAGPAGAVDKGDEEKAKKHFFRAITFFEEGRYEDALIDFEASYAFHPLWKVKFNIAICHFALDHYMDAAEYILSFLEEGGDDVTIEERAQAEELIGKLEKKLGVLRIVGEYTSFSVSIDGKPPRAALSGQEFFLEPGSHALEIVLNDDVTLSVTAEVVAGEKTEIVMKSSGKDKALETPIVVQKPVEEAGTGAGKEQKAEDKKTPGGGKSSPKMKPMTIAGISALGGGGALLIASCVTGGLVFKGKSLIRNVEDDYVEAYETGAGDEDLADLLATRDDYKDTARKLADTTTALLVIGGAAASAGIILLSVSAARGKSAEKKPAAILLPGPGSLSLVMSF
jgi:hypothetical protein